MYKIQNLDKNDPTNMQTIPTMQTTAISECIKKIRLLTYFLLFLHGTCLFVERLELVTGRIKNNFEDRQWRRGKTVVQTGIK